MSMLTADELKEALWADRATFVHVEQGKHISVLLHSIDTQWSKDLPPDQIHNKQVQVLLGFIRHMYDAGYNSGQEHAAETIRELILNDNNN